MPSEPDPRPTRRRVAARRLAVLWGLLGVAIAISNLRPTP